MLRSDGRTEAPDALARPVVPISPQLPASFKHRFRFTLAATSFVYPDDYVPNVRRLGSFVDAIELLFCESNALPSERTIQELAELAREHDLSYNVHLPSDVSIGHRAADERERAAKAILNVFEVAQPLAPSTFTLHLPCEDPSFTTESSAAWKHNVQHGLMELIRALGDPARISIENLDYPLEWLAEVIADLGLSVCMDVGHLLLHGRDIQHFFDRFGPRVSIIHLHGVDNGRDHLPLDRLSKSFEDTVMRVLPGFEGIVSLEVFAYDALAASLDWLDRRFKI
ncbi:MAG: cobamide remodeling phosphodiesterase CbiR [Hyphomicrobiales bacterium]